MKSIPASLTKGLEVFTFTGDDDLWVFIDDTLAIDLGGVHGAMTQSVGLDTLGLTVNVIKLISSKKYCKYRAL